jgi:predicted TIM-barrel fold metal-dependent hydrolase
LFFSGPAVEAFGFGRIIFGSVPSPVSRTQSNASEGYQIAREAFAELGIDQESVDAVFGCNAQRIYAAGSSGRA